MKTSTLKLKLSLACVCLLCVVTSAMAQQREGTSACAGLGEQAERKYDRFKDQTTTTLKSRKLLQTKSPSEELTVSVEATTKGEGKGHPKEVVLLFTSEAERWRYYEEAEAVFIVDGRRVEVGKAYATDTLPGPRSIKEKLKLTIPFEKFTQIIGGKRVDMKLGPTELQLTEETLGSLRAFASCVTGS